VHFFTKPELNRALIGFMASITFHSNLHAPSYHEWSTSNLRSALV
jgi:hypothetical protein